MCWTALSWGSFILSWWFQEMNDEQQATKNKQCTPDKSVWQHQILLSSFQVPTSVVSHQWSSRWTEVCLSVCLAVCLCLCLEEKISKAIVDFVTKRIVFAGKEFFIDYLLIYDEIGYILVPWIKAAKYGVGFRMGLGGIDRYSCSDCHVCSVTCL